MQDLVLMELDFYIPGLGNHDISASVTLNFDLFLKLFLSRAVNCKTKSLEYLFKACYHFGLTFIYLFKNYIIRTHSSDPLSQVFFYVLMKTW